MKVNVKFAFEDFQLRKINVALGGRGRRATRSEVRIWLAKIVQAGIEDVGYVPADARRIARQQAPAASVVAPKHAEHVLCANCNQPFGTHAAMRQSCPLSKTVKPRQRFKAPPTEASTP